MRRNAPTGLDALDLETREAAEAAARRSGLTLEDWVAATVTRSAGRAELPPRKSRRRPGDDLDAAIAKVTKVTRQPPNRDFEAIIAAAAAESERQARDHSSRTAVALESVASWIEQAEERLNEATRSTVEQQERLASALSEALGALKGRIDVVERQVAERADAKPTHSGPSPVSPALAEAFAALRGDMAKLVSRVDASRDGAWAPLVEDVRAEMERLQALVGGLATRDEVAGLEALVRGLAQDLAKARNGGEIKILLASVVELQQQVRQIAKDVSDNVHRQVSADVEHLRRKIDDLAASGVDHSVLDSLKAQQAEMREALVRMADPQRVERLSEEVSALGRLMAEMRLNQVGRNDFATLKNALEDIRSSLKRSEDEKTSSKVADQLLGLGQRLDSLLKRPESPSIDPIRQQLAAMADQLTALSSDRSRQTDTLQGLTAQIAAVSNQLRSDQSQQTSVLADLMERLSGQVSAVSEQVVSSRAPQSGALTGLMERLSGQVSAMSEQMQAAPADLMDRLDRIEDGLRQVGQNADTAQIELMLRSVQERLDRAPMSGDLLEGLEHQIEALTAKLPLAGTPEPLQAAIDETLAQVKHLRDEAGQIAERAVKAALREVQGSAASGSPLDMDAVRQGFAELKALQVSADKKTQQTLKAVHNALETLVHRAPSMPNVTWTSAERPGPAPGQPVEELPAIRLEAAVRKLHAAAISHVEEVTSSSGDAGAQRPADAEEILIEPGAPRTAPAAPTASFTASHEAEPAHVRANFIAAARRAALAAQAEQSPQAPKDEEPRIEHRDMEPGPDEEPSKPAISNQTLIDRIRQTFDTHRRPLLLSAALLILAAGTLQILSTAGQPEPLVDRQPAVVEQAPVVESASPATQPDLPADEAGRSKASDATAREPSMTGSLLEPSAFNPGPSAPAPFSKRIRDVAAIGALPAGLPAPLREAAQSGDPAALYEVAARAAEGRSVPQDPALAARLFETVAQSGLAPAQYRIGNFYEKGFGVSRNPALAKTWYERAAENGNARAMHNLAVLLAEGVEGKPDYPAAQRWFLAAAEHGVKDSQYNLGVLLARGLGVRQDLAQSYKWFALAAAQGDEEAAKKRDEVGGRLTPADLAAAKTTIGQWQARSTSSWANDVPPPPQGWSALRPATKRG
jgi:localization factor PodJL